MERFLPLKYRISPCVVVVDRTRDVHTSLLWFSWFDRISPPPHDPHLPFTLTSLPNLGLILFLKILDRLLKPVLRHLSRKYPRTRLLIVCLPQNKFFNKSLTQLI